MAEAPDWYNQMVRRHNADKNQFLLDFNIRDLVFVEGQPPDDPKGLRRVDEYLANALIESKFFGLVLSYSLTTGIRLLDGTTEKPEVIQVTRDMASREKSLQTLLYERVTSVATRNPNLLQQLGQPSEETLPYERDPMRAFMVLDRLLTRPYRTKDDKSIAIALLIDYLENLAPASQVGHRDQVLLAETLNRWANSRAIRQNGHLIVLLAEDINQVSPALYAGSAGTVNIRIERPDRDRRLAFLQWMDGFRRPTARADDFRRGESTSLSPERLANLTAGFNLAEIKNLIDYAHENTGGRLDEELIKQRKRDVIRAESRNLLEIVETDEIGFEHVGGLTHVKKALVDVAGWLRADETARLVPKGMLFVGPPGTGKSLVAQALARESGVNMVKLRDVQSMWVGESERNMSRVLDVARAFAPVIVFVDEIDQAYGQRNSGDTSGVSSRLFGKLLEFMGDNANRGKVLWVAASNRPDFVDAALISRFDRVIPFLLPDRTSREDILLRAMPNIVHLAWQDGPEPARWPNPAREAWRALLDETEEFSGRELELIARRGVELADGRALDPVRILEAARDFQHNHDRDVYQLQTLLALQVTNFREYLPDLATLSPVALRDALHSQGDGQLDPGLVQDLIWRLRRRAR